MEPSATPGRARLPLISIVIPVLNEEENVRRAYETVVATFAKLADKYTFEIVFTDNRSSDKTLDIIKEIAAADPRVHAAQFARNIGYQKSILTGYLLAHGAAAIQLDCDLQDPPELIPQMLDYWRQGFSVVYGVRVKRAEGFVITTARKLFYRVIAAISSDPIPLDSGDFRLIDRKVIEVLRRSIDHAPYLRGLIAVTGLKQIGFAYERRAREAGVTKFHMAELFRLSFDALASQSTLPLQLASYLGFTVALITAIAAPIYLALRLTIGGNWPDGFATLLFLLLGNIAITSLFFGLIGEYIGRISRDVKNYPLSVVDTAIGFPPDEQDRRDSILFLQNVVPDDQRHG